METRRGREGKERRGMEHNVGTADRVIRIVVGLGLLSLLVVLDSPSRWFGLVGIVPLVTALSGWCPLYTLLGIKTCPLEQKNGD